MDGNDSHAYTLWTIAGAHSRGADHGLQVWGDLEGHVVRRLCGLVATL